jgi:S1-C subfamily serine protease
MCPVFRCVADTFEFVHVDLLDAILLVVAVGFAISGYRQGFIVGSLSFVGFVGGAALGAQYGPAIARVLASGPNRQTEQNVVTVILLFIFALVGQFVFSAIGQYVKDQMKSTSSTTLDAIGGAGVSVLSLLLIAWALGSVLQDSSVSGIDSQIQSSAVLTTLGKVMPPAADTMFSDFRRQLSSGAFPQVFSAIGGEHLFQVSAPNPDVLNSAGYDAVKDRVVKITGDASSCSDSIEGSGFPISPDHIMSNAHVVAGVDQNLEVIEQNGRVLPATVVLYDPQVDISVLYVPNLDLTPLKFDMSAQTNDEAIVAGFPLNAASLVQQPARIAGTQDAVGPDIYQTGEVTRNIYQLRAVVKPGNSGGPLLSPSGTVYGVTFAAAVGSTDTGFALTAKEVASDAALGEDQTTPTSTEGCDN